MKKDITFAIVAAAVVAGVTFGLAAMRPDLPGKKSVPFSTTTGHKASPRQGTVVMRVNGEPISAAEFNAFLASAPEQSQAYYNSPQGRRIAAQELVKLKALEQEGEKLGVADDPQVAMQLASARANLIAGAALQKLTVKPSEARLRQEYEKEKKNLQSVELSHILVAYEGGSVPPRAGAPLPADKAMQRARSIEAALRSGTDFAEAARRASDDVQSAQQGGQLGAVSPAAMPPELAGTIAALSPGEISKPVQSQFGIHIFKAGKQQSRPFEEVRPMFEAKVQREEAEATLNRLVSGAKVDLDPKFFPEPPPNAVPGQGRP